MGQITDEGKTETKKDNALFSLAVGGNTFQHSNLTIWDYAKIIRDMGCLYALVFDEGQDVFQTFTNFQEQGLTDITVKRKRNRLRAYLSLRQQEVS